jgi:protein SCO1/2
VFTDTDKSTKDTTAEDKSGVFRRTKPAYVLAIPPIVIVLGVLAFAVFQPIQVLPRISLAPGFAFVDQDGERLTNEDLRGSLVFYTFTYTGCAAECPDTGEAMSSIKETVDEIDTGGIPVRFVTISFDPDRDTPTRLRSYAQELGADTEVWRFVTGEPARLKNVIGGGFSTYYSQNEDGTFAFDPAFALVDGWGILRAKYRTANPDPELIRRDVELLVDEVQNQEGASRLAYEAAHLFLCYPD